jgi:hypothetical protein
MQMYYIVSLCQGPKFEPILPHWMQRINERCKNCNIHLVKFEYQSDITPTEKKNETNLFIFI